MDANSEKLLSQVHPLLAERVRTLVGKLTGDYRVVSGLRTFAQQDALYAKGRTAPGPVVTQAKGGQSNHNYGLAVDICNFVNGQPDWNTVGPFITMGHMAELVGLEWGGDWKKFVDKPHVQLKGLAIKDCLALYKKGGLPAVWQRATEINGSVGVASVPQPQDASAPANPIEANVTVTVLAGDSLWSIAQDHGTTVAAIKALNGLTSDLIKPGQELKIR